MTAKIVHYKWLRPQPVTIWDMAFGPPDINEYCPTWVEIPDTFQKETQESIKWHEIVNAIFFCGAKAIKVTLKSGMDGVTQAQVLQHCSTVLHSFDLSHERKVAGMAYLLSLWCEEFIYERCETNFGGD